MIPVYRLVRDGKSLSLRAAYHFRASREYVKETEHACRLMHLHMQPRTGRYCCILLSQDDKVKGVISSSDAGEMIAAAYTSGITRVITCQSAKRPPVLETMRVICDIFGITLIDHMIYDRRECTSHADYPTRSEFRRVGPDLTTTSTEN